MKPLPRFIVVIHTADGKDPVGEAIKAWEGGAGGIILIDHGRDYRALLSDYGLVRAAFPEAWIGLNFLDLPARGSVRIVPGDFDGLWVDNCYCSVRDQQDLAGLLSIDCCNGGAGESWRVFASVAFKHQRLDRTIEDAASLASDLFDVVVTSGTRTGRAPDTEKTRLMKAAAGDKPFAIASGIKASNVHEFLDHVDCFMVSTGISTNDDFLDPAKVAELGAIINNYNPIP